MYRIDFQRRTRSGRPRRVEHTHSFVSAVISPSSVGMELPRLLVHRSSLVNAVRRPNSVGRAPVMEFSKNLLRGNHPVSLDVINLGGLSCLHW
jgi:hypothetical protein